MCSSSLPCGLWHERDPAAALDACGTQRGGRLPATFALGLRLRRRGWAQEVCVHGIGSLRTDKKKVDTVQASGCATPLFGVVIGMLCLSVFLMGSWRWL